MSEETLEIGVGNLKRRHSLKPRRFDEPHEVNHAAFSFRGRIRRLLSLTVILFLTGFGAAAIAAAESEQQTSDLSTFANWKADLREDALSRGISGSLFDEVMKGVEPLPEVLERDRYQPEFRLTFDRYIGRAVTETRISRGRDLLNRHAGLLKEVESKYGVQPRFLVAFWGLESNYGDNTGGFSVIPALVTLAFDERRAEFFREQLFHAFQILQEGHIPGSEMTGSWAGAMGQLQFIPSTFTGYAIDFDGDGKRDIWNSLPDVFGSAANFLSASSWDGSKTWGREVRLPDDFDWSLIGLSSRKSLNDWQRIGVRRADGRPLPQV
ncbi:MAG: lytic murein transglycosylase, partial [Kiloniellales bacterium]|nr:lytic murein transglycosylase [Kiloniellales bacterium]